MPILQRSADQFRCATFWCDRGFTLACTVCVSKQIIFLAEQLEKSWLSFSIFESMCFKVILEDTGKCWRGLGGGGTKMRHLFDVKSQMGVERSKKFRRLMTTNALVDCIWSACVCEEGLESNSMKFSAPSPPIKVINATPELPQHHGLWAVFRPSFTSESGLWILLPYPYKR